jgi:hypothetical protein
MRYTRVERAENKSESGRAASLSTIVIGFQVGHGASSQTRHRHFASLICGFPGETETSVMNT